MSDDFRLGIKLGGKKGTAFSLFYDFNRADIILCSPMGIQSLENKKEEEGVRATFGFLSSTEVLFIMKPNIFKMQNYTLFNELLSLMNKMPLHSETTNDFNTIREYYAENISKMYRQTIVYSDFWFAELGSSLASHALNFEGTIRNKVSYSCIFDDFKSAKLFGLEFRRMDIQELSRDFDSRFNFFVNQVWMPMQKAGVKDRTVIFVSSHAEFTKVKQHLK